MKFKKDGKVFEDIGELVDNTCAQFDICAECPISRANNERNISCEKFAEKHSSEAARLMGYEVVEDGETIENCLDNAIEAVKQIYKMSEKEANMEKVNDAAGGRESGLVHKQKPRICEVLGVEVGEEWRYGITTYHVRQSDGMLYFLQEDAWDLVRDAEVVYEIINHPENIVCKPRFTEEEVKRVKAAKVLWPRAESVKKETGAVMLYGADGEAIAGIDTELFPSILPGETVKLSDIVGGGT